MPRQRSARVAVLGSARRSPSASSPLRPNAALKRRAVAGVLVAISLVLLTVYFRESPGGGLHGFQSAGASVLRPFEVAAERIARPFRDAAAWANEVLDAKSENEEFRRQLDEWRQRAIESQFALKDYELLREQLRYRDGPRFPTDYRAVTAAVIARAAPTQFEQQITVAAGSNAGIRLHAPVVVSGKLVGRVTVVTPSVAQVTLLTDESSFVPAVDLRTGADGIVQQREGTSSLIFYRVSKEQVVEPGDAVVTAGWKSDRFSSIYPRGIPIGEVTHVSQLDTDLYKQVQIEPFVDFGSLDAVVVLVSLKPEPVVP